MTRHEALNTSRQSLAGTNRLKRLVALKGSCEPAAADEAPALRLQPVAR